MPLLVANYQKKVLETRIVKFASVMKQAVSTKIAEEGNIDHSMLTTARSADEAEEFFNTNYASYMKITGTKKLTQGFAIGFPDGSGAYVHIDQCGWGPLYQYSLVRGL